MTSTPAILRIAVVLLMAGSWVAAEGVDMAPPSAARPATVAAGEIGPLGRRIAAAEPGAVLEVEPGVYRERLVIDKPITLVGKGRPVIDGGGRGDIVEITAPDVTLRGFVIRNTGIDLDQENAGIRVVAPRVLLEDNHLEDILFGIDLRQAPDSVVRGNRIGGKKLDIARRGDGLRLWRSDRTTIDGNVIHDGRDAILWYSSHVTVRNNTAENCRYGLHLMFSDNVTIEGNRFSANSVGVYLMYSTEVAIRGNELLRNRGPSGYGLGLKETDRFCVSQNLITGNRVGVYLDGSPFTNARPGEFTRNTIAFNDIGITFLPSVRNNELVANNFIENLDQVAVAGRGNLDANRFWKGDRGNFWSDYTGYDQDRNGVGDFVHESQTLFGSMAEREPKLRLFLFSPVQQAIELVGRALPAIRPEPKFTDEVPLMRPVEIAHVAAGATPLPAGARLAQAGVGAAMLGLGLALVAAAAAAARREMEGTP